MMTRRHVLEIAGVGVVGLLAFHGTSIAAQEAKTAVVTLTIEGMT